MKNLMIAQSGGPTSAINATLVGIVERAASSGRIDKIYGARNGIIGMIRGDITEIGETLSSPSALERLSATPSSALGSCRVKLRDATEDPESYEAIFSRMREYGVGYFIYIGGNDSMDTVAKLSAYAATHDIDVSVMGAPKTIDNDLYGMDHSPGFGSAARYVATTLSEIWCDCRVYGIPMVTIIEIMGRNAGWLTASSVLARGDGCPAPHLIYLPETPFDRDRFLGDVKEKLAQSQSVVVAVCEGVRYADGSYVALESGPTQKDDFGHATLTGSSRVLGHFVRDAIGCKVRAIELSLLQRCAGHLTSRVDIAEARMLGQVAIDRAMHGESGNVAVLRRLSDDPYRVAYGTLPAVEIANRERKVPLDWINEGGNDVTEEMLRYLAPLVGEPTQTLPHHLFL